MAFATIFDLASLNGANGFTIGGIDTGDKLGYAQQGVGDVNGDGYEDLVVTAYERSEVYLVFGRAGGWPAFIDVGALAAGEGMRVTDSDRIGETITAGDINGDGFADLVFDAFALPIPAANVLFGHAGAFPATFDLASLNGQNGFRLTGPADSFFSGSMALSGDLNGDGFDDLLVGADAFEDFIGRAYVLFGKAGGFASVSSVDQLTGANGFRLTAGGGVEQLGHRVGHLGDINGDGFGDMAVSGMQIGGAKSFAGDVYVLFGKAQGFSASIDLATLNGTAGFAIHGLEAIDFLGDAAISAGDVNGDGLADFLLTATGVDFQGNTLAGAVYVIYGKTGPWSGSFDLTGLNGANGFRVVGGWPTAGASIAGAAAGDVNGDGFDDLVVSFTGADLNGRTNSGTTHIIYGKAQPFAATLDVTSLSASTGVRIDGLMTEDHSGRRPFSAGDVNHDGLGDVIFGAVTGDWPGHVDTGAAYVIFGQSSTAATTGADAYVGTAGADKWKSLGGNDTLQGLAGADRLDGGPGADKALYAGTAGQYDFWETADGTWRVKDLRAGAPEGTDTLISVESLQFGDKTVKILGLTTAEKLTDAYSSILRSTAGGAELTFLNNLIGAVNGSTKTLGAAITEIVGKADQTTAVAAMSYQFFLNFVPSKGGFDYLVSPQGPNPNNINSAYYQSFNIENRYINFAVNLGKVGEGAPSFLAEYGGKTLFQATKDAYMEIFGGTVVDSKINTILDSSVGSMSRAQYFALYGGDGLTGIGTKAAMVGWLLTEAAKADLGMYANSSNAFLTDLADGAQTLVDVVGTYGKAEYIFNG